MKITLILMSLITLAVLFACLLPALIKHDSKSIATAHAKHYRVRFKRLTWLERLAAPFVRAALALQMRTQQWFGSSRLVACNIAEGTHAGNVTKLAGAALATRYLVVKKGADTAHVIACAAITDRPIGICTDEAAAAEDPVNVELFGSAGRTMLGVAAGDIVSGAMVATTATGLLQTAVATQWAIGRALTDASAGQLVEFDPINSDRVLT
jgi:hypothetical protein